VVFREREEKGKEFIGVREKTDKDSHKKLVIINVS
jgi:hypothetical protein